MQHTTHFHRVEKESAIDSSFHWLWKHKNSNAQHFNSLVWRLSLKALICSYEVWKNFCAAKLLTTSLVSFLFDELCLPNNTKKVTLLLSFSSSYSTKQRSKKLSGKSKGEELFPLVRGPIKSTVKDVYHLLSSLLCTLKPGSWSEGPLLWSAPFFPAWYILLLQSVLHKKMGQ